MATVSREGEHFFIKLTRQPAREILAESPTSFFMQGLPVKISFELGPDGKATGLVIHQGGHDGQAPRIDEAAAKAIEALPPPTPKGHPMARTWPMMPGIAPRTLTSSDGNRLDYWPCFSPDGKTVLFSRTTDGGKNWTLMRVLVSGGEAVPFLSQPLSVSATRADWGRTGKVAFTGTGIGWRQRRLDCRWRWAQCACRNGHRRVQPTFLSLLVSGWEKPGGDGCRGPDNHAR